ncbi:MAG TPA: transposase [Herpetosiphonaceae bacterium]
MSDTFSIRTVSCRLRVDPATDTALRETQAAFNAAATYCAQVAWEQGITNKNTLHHIVYGATRAQFELGAQLACCARDKAAEAVRASRQHNNATCPTFRPDSSIRYDARTYRLMERDQVSLNTLHGRVVAQLDLGDFQRRYLYDLTWAIGGAELIRKHNVWYLCITQSKRLPEPDEPVGVIGVDFGIVNLATSSDGETYSGGLVDRVRERYHLRRQRLQVVGTKSAKRRLKRNSGKERRFQKNVNHVISKCLVHKAAETCKALVLEDLTHIRKRTKATVQHGQRRRHSSWAFAQLRMFVAYKAALAGVRVIIVDPRNTSRTCSRCGYCDKHNRKSQSSFLCLNCGFVAAADVNAAVNIERAAVNQPMAARAMPVAASHLL